MKKLFLIVMALLSTAGLTLAQTATHRYQIKSGIANEVTRLKGVETPAVHYFDNYGDCETVIQTIDMGDFGSFKNTSVVKKDKAWMVSENGQSKGFDNPIADLTFNNPSEEVVAKYNIQDTGEDEVFLGHKCRKYTYELKQGRKTAMVTAWVYKGITLKSVSKIGRKTTEFEMTDFKENAKVPSEVFNVPE